MRVEPPRTVAAEAIIDGMMFLFVERLQQLLTGFTRVTFTGCAGDPAVWEQAAMDRLAERGNRPLLRETSADESGAGQTGGSRRAGGAL